MLAFRWAARKGHHEAPPAAERLPINAPHQEAIL
jgi:hypothetical protein